MNTKKLITQLFIFCLIIATALFMGCTGKARNPFNQPSLPPSQNNLYMISLQPTTLLIDAQTSYDLSAISVRAYYENNTNRLVTNVSWSKLSDFGIFNSPIFRAPPTPGKILFECQYFEGMIGKSAILTFEVIGPERDETLINLGDAVFIEFSEIAPGTFEMGSPTSEAGRFLNEGPQRTVRISQGFYMSKKVITQKQWLQVMGSWPELSPSDSYGIGDDYPAYYISWFDAVEFCNELSKNQALTPVYIINKSQVLINNKANGYRLPTEAEWEYAARAGTTTPYYWGDSKNAAFAWTSENSGQKVQPVGLKTPNSFGLYDMSGNIWEWCWDWYDQYDIQSTYDPEGPMSGTGKLLRGGSWNHSWTNARSANRNWSDPLTRWDDHGLRVVKTIDYDL